MTLNTKVWSVMISFCIYIWAAFYGVFFNPSLWVAILVWVTGLYVGAMAIPLYREYKQNETKQQRQTD